MWFKAHFELHYSHYKTKKGLFQYMTNGFFTKNKNEKILPSDFIKVIFDFLKDQVVKKSLKY